MNPFKYIIIGTTSCIKFIISFIKHFFIGLVTIITFIPKYLVIGTICLFSEKKQRELKMEDKIIPIIITTLSITTYLICIFILTRWFVQSERNKKFADNLNDLSQIISKEENSDEEYKVPNKTYTNENYPDDLTFLNVNLDPYIRQNSETVAWLLVNGTNISYPVVQHKDNSYYLNHNFYKRKSMSGWVFADYRDNFETFNNNTIIYGHNLINRTMFGQLPRLLNSSWQSNPNYHYIKLSTKTTNSIWQVFSVYKIKPTTDYLQSVFNSMSTYEKFLKTIKNRSSYDFNVDVSTTDKIITLSTCDDTGTKRVAVHAKLINIEDK